MAEPIVIYDPEKEIAAIVDTDNRVGFGPAMIGPDAATRLDSFLLTVPFDVTAVPSAVLRDWFEQWAAASFPATAQASGTADTGKVGSKPDQAMVDAALAEHTAAASAAEPPAPAPADTDMAAHASEAGTVTPAVNPSGAPSETSGTTVPDAATNAPVAETGTDQAQPQADKPYEGPCFACDGTGNVPGSADGETNTCNLCKGTGRLPAPAAA